MSEPFSRRDLFGGRGEVTVHDLLAGRLAPPFQEVLWCTLEPDGSVGRHHQEQFPEIVVGLSGTGEAEVDGQSQPLEGGTVVFLPLGSSLSLRNTSSSESLQYLIVKASDVSAGERLADL